MSPNESPTSAPIALPPKRERRKHARPGELLEAALHVFVDQGFGAAKVEEIASRAGVSKGTLFLYFASKEELFKAVVRDTIVGQLSQFQAAVDTFQGPTPELMRTMVHAWWQRSHANGSTGIAKLMLSEGKHFPELANFYRPRLSTRRATLSAACWHAVLPEGNFVPSTRHMGPIPSCLQ